MVNIEFGQQAISWDLQDYLRSLSPLTESDFSLFRDQLSVKRFAKNTQLNSSVNDRGQILFLNRGVARSFVLDLQGRDYTSAFHYNARSASVANIFVTDYAKVMRDEKSSLLFETLTEVEVVSVSQVFIKKMYENNVNWGRIGRIIAQECFYHSQQRALDLLTLQASERYQLLLAELPIPSVDIPQKYIASYLGITPPSLSRIKKTLGLSK